MPSKKTTKKEEKIYQGNIEIRIQVTTSETDGETIANKIVDILEQKYKIKWNRQDMSISVYTLSEDEGDEDLDEEIFSS